MATPVPNDEQSLAPYSSVVEIEVHFPGDYASNGEPEYSIASGVIVGPNQILTAAHVFENEQGETPDQIVILTQSEAPAGVQYVLSNSTDIWTDIGGSQSLSAGLSSLDYIQANDPQLQPNGSVANVANDIALLTVSTDLLSESNVAAYNLQALPIEAAAADGTYQMIGFDGASNTTLLSDTEAATIDTTTYAGDVWTGPFQAVPGMSGGPLVSADDQVVGIQSSINQLTLDGVPIGPTTAYANYISSAEYTEIQAWMNYQVSANAWQSSTNGDFGVAANWSLDSVPNTNDEAVISVSSPSTITSSQNQEIGSLFISQGATLAITGGTFTDDGALNNSGNIDVNGGTFVVDAAASGGTATIENGGTLEFGGPSNVSITFEVGSASSSTLNVTTVDDPLVNAGTIPSGTNDGGFGTVLTDINDAGQVVGVYYAGVAVYSAQAFLYSDETFTPLGQGTDGSLGDILNINNAGQIAGSFSWPDGQSDAYIDDGVAQEIAVRSNYGNFLNNLGDVAGLDNSGPVLYSLGTYSTSGFPADDGLQRVFVGGLNDDDQIVGTVSSIINGYQYVYNGFLYAGGAYTTVDYPDTDGGGPDSGTLLTAINDAGQIVGYYTGASVVGFLDSDGVFTTLSGPAGAEGVVPLAINNEGQIVGTYTDSTGAEQAFLYSDGSYTTIENPVGADNVVPYAINDNGQVVGYYTDSTGLTHGFVTSANSILEGGASTLSLADPAGYSGSVYAFAPGEAIDLSSVAYDSNYSVELGANNVLQVTENGSTCDIKFDPSQDFSGLYFHVVPDGTGGSEIILNSFQYFDSTVASGQSVAYSSGQTASGTTISAGGTLTVDGIVGGTNVGGLENISSGGIDYQATINSGGQQYVSSGGVSNDTTINDGGAQYVQSGGNALDTLISDPGLQIVSVGGTATDCTVSAGEQDVYGTANDTLVENGGLQVVENGGTATNTTISGGTVEVFADGTLNGSLTFESSSGALQIDGASLPTAPTTLIGASISGFGSGDTIDLTSADDVPASHADMNYATDVLTITDGGNSYNLDFSGDFTGDYFHLAPDNSGNGTLITEDDQPCYCRGTLIRADTGELAVEHLAIGDKLETGSGALRPIKWIGRRSYNGRFVMGRKDILPICIRAGALADNVPRRDLWISPHHAMYLDGVLIEAKDLVNGVSIVQAEHVANLEYFHIELETHDVIVVEGALSETFLDDNSRGMFNNAHEYRALYPETVPAPARYCAPRLEDGYEVEAARRYIAQRAGIRHGNNELKIGHLRGFVDLVDPHSLKGWAQNIDHPEAPVCLNIFAGDKRIGQVLANRHREDLKRAGLGSGQHSFAFELPEGLEFDLKTLEVRRSLDGAKLPMSQVCVARISVAA
jgi:autotransporter passenger strand-loop-strand repeat protein/probable HAF family extracellular repeat protein